MKELGLPEGMEIVGVTDNSGSCTISTAFESHVALEAFVDSRGAAGRKPRRHRTRACDGNPKEIELLLSVAG
jgi:hypothetical protein